MAVTLTRVIEKQADGRWLVEVTHGGQPLRIGFDGDEPRALSGQLVFYELSFTRVVSIAETSAPPGITALDEVPSEPGAPAIAAFAATRHRLTGIIEDQMELGDGATLYDLFIETGPDYLALDQQELGGFTPRIGARVTVVVEGLVLQPSRA